MLAFNWSSIAVMFDWVTVGVRVGALCLVRRRRQPWIGIPGEPPSHSWVRCTNAYVHARYNLRRQQSMSEFDRAGVLGGERGGDRGGAVWPGLSTIFLEVPDRCQRFPPHTIDEYRCSKDGARIMFSCLRLDRCAC